MGYSEKYRKKLEDIINKGKSKDERVKLSFIAGKTVITQPTSDNIRKDYDAINEAIDNLDTSDKLYAKKKYDLLKLKKEVPKNYAISKSFISEIQEVINEIIGKPNKSNV